MDPKSTSNKLPSTTTTNTRTKEPVGVLRFSSKRKPTPNDIFSESSSSSSDSEDMEEISSDDDNDSVILLPSPPKVQPPVVTISDDEEGEISSDDTEVLDTNDLANDLDDLEILQLRRNVLEAILTKEAANESNVPLQEDNYETTQMELSPLDSEERLSEIDLPPTDSPTDSEPPEIEIVAETVSGVTKHYDIVSPPSEPLPRSDTVPSVSVPPPRSDTVSSVSVPPPRSDTVSSVLVPVPTVTKPPDTVVLHPIPEVTKHPLPQPVASQPDKVIQSIPIPPPIRAVLPPRPPSIRLAKKRPSITESSSVSGQHCNDPVVAEITNPVLGRLADSVQVNNTDTLQAKTGRQPRRRAGEEGKLADRLQAKVCGRLNSLDNSKEKNQPAQTVRLVGAIIPEYENELNRRRRNSRTEIFSLDREASRSRSRKNSALFSRKRKSVEDDDEEDRSRSNSGRRRSTFSSQSTMDPIKDLPPRPSTSSNRHGRRSRNNSGLEDPRGRHTSGQNRRTSPLRDILSVPNENRPAERRHISTLDITSDVHYVPPLFCVDRRSSGQFGAAALPVRETGFSDQSRENRVPGVEPPPLPIRHISEAQPIRHISEAQPIRHISEAQPNRHISEAQPNRHISEAQPNRHISEAQPNRHISEAQPNRHISEAQPIRVPFSKVSSTITKESDLSTTFSVVLNSGQPAQYTNSILAPSRPVLPVAQLQPTVNFNRASIESSEFAAPSKSKPTPPAPPPAPKVILVNPQVAMLSEDEDQLRARLLIELSKNRFAAEKQQRESFNDESGNIVVKIRQRDAEKGKSNGIECTGNTGSGNNRSVYKWERSKNPVTSNIAPLLPIPRAVNGLRSIQRTIYNPFAFQSKHANPELRQLRYTIPNTKASKSIQPIIIHVRGETSSDESDSVTQNPSRTVRFGRAVPIPNSNHTGGHQGQINRKKSRRVVIQQKLPIVEKQDSGPKIRRPPTAGIPASFSASMDTFIEKARESAVAKMKERNVKGQGQQSVRKVQNVPQGSQSTSSSEISRGRNKNGNLTKGNERMEKTQAEIRADEDEDELRSETVNESGDTTLEMEAELEEVTSKGQVEFANSRLATEPPESGSQVEDSFSVFNVNRRKKPCQESEQIGGVLRIRNVESEHVEGSGEVMNGPLTSTSRGKNTPSRVTTSLQKWAAGLYKKIQEGFPTVKLEPSQPDESIDISSPPNENIDKSSQPNENADKSSQPNESIDISSHPIENIDISSQPNENIDKSSQPNENINKSSQPNENVDKSQPNENTYKSSQLNENIYKSSQPNENVSKPSQPNAELNVDTLKPNGAGESDPLKEDAEVGDPFQPSTKVNDPSKLNEEMENDESKLIEKVGINPSQPDEKVENDPSKLEENYPSKLDEKVENDPSKADENVENDVSKLNEEVGNNAWELNEELGNVPSIAAISFEDVEKCVESNSILEKSPSVSNIDIEIAEENKTEVTSSAIATEILVGGGTELTDDENQRLGTLEEIERRDEELNGEEEPPAKKGKVNNGMTTINILFPSFEGTTQEKQHKELLLRERLLKAAIQRRFESSELQRQLRTAEGELVSKRLKCMSKVDGLNEKLKRLSTVKLQQAKLEETRAYYLRQLENVEQGLDGGRKKIEKLETIVRARTSSLLVDQSQYIAMTESCIEYGGKLSGIRYLLPNSNLAEYDRKYGEAQKGMKKLSMCITLPENPKISSPAPSSGANAAETPERMLKKNQRLCHTGITNHSYVETDDEDEGGSSTEGHEGRKKRKIPSHGFKDFLTAVDVPEPKTFEPYVSLLTNETKQSLRKKSTLAQRLNGQRNKKGKVQQENTASTLTEITS